MNEYAEAWSKYAVFKGCATRKDYWMFVLVNFIVSLLLLIFGSFSDLFSILYSVYGLAAFLPSLAVGVRRIHDGGHSGWWMLAPFINLIFLCEPTNRNSRYC